VSASVSRRQLLQTTGLTVTLGALVAACSESAEGEPGRVGYAPPVTPLPTVEVNDAVYMRTATSIEQTLIETYGTLVEAGVLDADAQDVLERLVEDHTAAVAATSDLTEAAGGEPYPCANQWYMDRVVGPLLEQILGDEEQGIPPSDDPQRDSLVLANGLESMVAAMYQQMVERLAERDLRADGMVLGAESARHAAALAIMVTGAPEAYVSPELAGEEVLPDESGFTPIFAIPALFGSLAAIPITVGAPNEAGTRYSTVLETPAENSFIYDGMTCDA
jgi:hypothetical protein